MCMRSFCTVPYCTAWFTYILLPLPLFLSRRHSTNHFMWRMLIMIIIRLFNISHIERTNEEEEKITTARTSLKTPMKIKQKNQQRFFHWFGMCSGWLALERKQKPPYNYGLLYGIQCESLISFVRKSNEYIEHRTSNIKVKSFEA